MALSLQNSFEMEILPGKPQMWVVLKCVIFIIKFNVIKYFTYVLYHFKNLYGLINK